MDILVVEDEFLLALALEDCLTRAGHRVVGLARSRAEALEVAARSHPDLALLDIRLADGENGVEIAAELEERMDVPVLYASGQVQEAERSGVGMGVLRKPYSEADVLRSVEVVRRLRKGETPPSSPSSLTLFDQRAA